VDFLNAIVSFGDLGGVQPTVEVDGDCSADVQVGH